MLFYCNCFYYSFIVVYFRYVLRSCIYVCLLFLFRLIVSVRVRVRDLVLPPLTGMYFVIYSAMNNFDYRNIVPVDSTHCVYSNDIT